MTFGVTTFKERFDSHFKPLMDSLCGYQTIVAVNASASGGLDDGYRSAMMSHLSFISNASLIMYQQMRGLAKMWNDLIIHSPTDCIILLNDDVMVNDPRGLIDACEQSIGKTNGLMLLNGSFSHFCITKQFASSIGWFDERLLGFGEEDGDMVYRYHQRFREPLVYLKTDMISNMSSEIRDDGVKRGIGKYSKFNRDFALNGLNGAPPKYTEDINGTIGMFDKPMIKQISDEKQYPYEPFFMQNRRFL